MTSGRVPSTPAVLALRAANVEFTTHFYSYVERSVLALPAIYINGGSRGFLLRMLNAQPVDVAIQ